MEELSSKFKNKTFWAFLALHLIIWTSVSLIRTILPTDVLEGIYWGSFWDLGTTKHPPLAGWVTYFVYNLFKTDFSIYLLSQTCILIGFIYTYKLARFFLDETKSILSVILLEGCWCYSYITGYYGFNPDVILFLTLPAITYYFYKCMKTSKPLDWLKLALFVGFSFLNKYQTALTIIPMFIWAIIFKREVFKDIKTYLAMGIAFLIFLPHIFWLFQHDFLPFSYFEGELTATCWYSCITKPLIFALVQLGVIAGSILIFALLKIKEGNKFELIKDYDKKDFWYLILVGLTPLVIHLLMGVFSGGTMRPRWGFTFLYLTGIMLFYFIPCKITKKEFMLAVKSALTIMFLTLISFGTLLAVEKNFRSRYPVPVVFEDMKTIWAKEYKTPLKYVGGYIEYAIPLTIYGDTHPDILLDTFKKPLWLDPQDIRKSGVLIIDRHPDGVINWTNRTVPNWDENTEINPIPYKFTVHNAFNMPREYTVYYYIVPPQN